MKHGYRNFFPWMATTFSWDSGFATRSKLAKGGGTYVGSPRLPNRNEAIWMLSRESAACTKRLIDAKKGSLVSPEVTLLLLFLFLVQEGTTSKSNRRIEDHRVMGRQMLEATDGAACHPNHPS
jgi:hypothetical protein